MRFNYANRAQCEGRVIHTCGKPMLGIGEVVLTQWRSEFNFCNCPEHVDAKSVSLDKVEINILKDQIVHLESELDRKEKLLNEMWQHTMDRDWPQAKLISRVRELEGEIERLKAGK